MSYVLSYTWEWVSIGKLLVQTYLSEHSQVMILAWSGMVSVANSVTAHLCNMLPVADCIIIKLKAKEKIFKNCLKNDKRGRAAVRYSSCQAGTESEECVGKNNLFFWESSYCWCCICCVVSVVWSYCQRLCSLYNSWITGGLFSGRLGRRWRRGLAGQRRRKGLQTNKTETLKFFFFFFSNKDNFTFLLKSKT